MALDRVSVRQFVKSHDLDTVKLSNQRSVLGSFNRPDGERLAFLWNLTKDMSTDDIILALVGPPAETVLYRDCRGNICTDFVDSAVKTRR